MSADVTNEGSADRPSSPTVDALTAIAEAGTLDKTVEIVDSVADESVMRFGREGYRCVLVSPSNVYMARVHLSEGGFETVGEGMFPAGINHEAFADYIGKADDGQLVNLSFDAETGYLNVAFGPFDRDFALIDTDSIRKEPDIPELELSNTFEIGGEMLKDVIDVSQMTSDHVKIEGDPNDECVRFVADGDTDTNTATLDEELGFADVKESCHSLVSLDYLEDAVKVIPKSATVEVRFGDEFPVKLFWEYADGNGQVEQMIAPRVTSS